MRLLFAFSVVLIAGGAIAQTEGGSTSPDELSAESAPETGTSPKAADESPASPGGEGSAEGEATSPAAAVADDKTDPESPEAGTEGEPLESPASTSDAEAEPSGEAEKGEGPEADSPSESGAELYPPSDEQTQDEEAGPREDELDNAPRKPASSAAEAPLGPPRSDPFMSIAAGAGACACGTCAPPLCAAGGGVLAAGLLFLPTALVSLVVVGAPTSLVGGLCGGVCVGGPIGATATTAAAAAVPYYDAEEDEAAVDALMGGVPAIVLGVAALALLPVGLAVSSFAFINLLSLSGGAVDTLTLLILASLVVPLGLLPSLAMTACSPLLALVGTSAARIQYAYADPTPEALPKSTPRTVQAAMRF